MDELHKVEGLKFSRSHHRDVVSKINETVDQINILSDIVGGLNNMVKGIMKKKGTVKSEQNKDKKVESTVKG